MHDKQPEVRYEAMAPVLDVPDVSAAIAFYRDRLEFAVVHTADDPPVYAVLRRDGVSLHLARAERAGGGFYLSVRGVDALYEQLRRAGVTIGRPIEDAPYGMRDFTIQDPAGNGIQIGEPVRARP